jgi:hypothetical protein
VILINNAEVIQGDLLASNGVAHLIDAVLLLDPPQILTQPKTPVDAFVGNTITLSVAATGPDPIQYQWTKDGMDLEGATATNFAISDAQVSDSGVYAVTVTNPGGTVTSSNAVVTVTLPTEPPIIGPPAVVDGNFTITWTGGGELETATDLIGPWEPTGNTSGSFSEPIGSGNRFYRIVRP